VGAQNNMTVRDQAEALAPRQTYEQTQAQTPLEAQRRNIANFTTGNTGLAADAQHRADFRRDNQGGAAFVGGVAPKMAGPAPTPGSMDALYQGYNKGGFEGVVKADPNWYDKPEWARTKLLAGMTDNE
jgi:hypothetical protein